MLCAQCQQSMPAGLPQGLCPQCLLKAALAPVTLPTEVLLEPLHDGPSSAATLAISSRSSTDLPSQRIGRYTLLQELGEGGFGVVYLAQQTEPVKRRVALKVIKPGMDSREIIARFEAERQALALMEHPNIAQVFDGGTTDSGRPYFVMELVKGVPITQYCDEARLTMHQRLQLFLDLLAAVQHAHQKGIIHRDLKPSNILVSPHDARPVVKVIDFGIAKAIHLELTGKTLFTGHGRLLGTPEYMSPEQAEVSALNVDTRSDLYSLGVVLYELMTGRTPLDPRLIRQAGYDEIQRMIREDEAPRPSTRLSTMGPSLPAVAQQRGTDPLKLTRQVRGELDWIVMKALEKERERRYATADAFAEDIRRHLADEPVSASPPSRFYRLRKLARRNKIALMTASAVIVSMIGGLAASLWQAERASHAERRERQEKSTVQTYAKALSKRLAEAAWSSFHEADRLLAIVDNQSSNERPRQDEDEKCRLALLHLARGVRYDPGNAVIRERFAWEVLLRRGAHFSIPEAVHDPAQQDEIVDFCGLSSDGETLVSLSRKGSLRSTSLASKKTVSRTLPPGQRQTIILSPDGGTLITTSAHKFDEKRWQICSPPITMWDTTSGLSKFHLNVSISPEAACFSRDSQHLAVAGSDNILRVWNARGEIVFETTCRKPVASVLLDAAGDHVFTSDLTGGTTCWNVAAKTELFSVAGAHSPLLSPDGSLFAASASRRIPPVGTNHEVGIYDGSNGSLKSTIQNAVEVLAFSSDNQNVLTRQSGSYSILLWNLENPREPAATFPHLDYVRSAAFSPDGSTVVTCGEDGHARVWSGVYHSLLAVLPGRASCTNAAFTRNGRHVTTMHDSPRGHGPEARRWQTGWTLPFHQLVLQGSINTAGFDPSGTRFLAGGGSGKAQVMELAAAPHSLTLPVGGRVWLAEFSEDGKQIFTAGMGRGTLEIWNSMTGALQGVVPIAAQGEEEFSVDHVALSSIAGLVAWADQKGGVHVHRLPDGRAVTKLEAPPSVMGLSFSQEGSLLASFSANGQISVFDMTSKKAPLSYLHAGGVRGGAFSPDGRLLAICGENGEAVLLDTSSGRIIRHLPHPSSVNQAQWSRDGLLLLTEDVGHDVKVWNISSGSLLSTLPHPGLRADRASMDLAPAGTRVLTNGALKAHLWHAQSGSILATLEGGYRPALAQFSRDGQRLFTLATPSDTAACWWEMAPVEMLAKTSPEESVAPEDFELTARVLCAAKISLDGKVMQLGLQEWLASIEEMKKRAAVPGRFQPWARWLAQDRKESISPR